MACPGGFWLAGLRSAPRVRRLFVSPKADPNIAALYEKWLGKPLGEKAHHLLHTHYNAQPV